jgi:hypothetical protein
MSSGASTQWFWSDWLGDQEVRRLTPAERGVWIDLLALAAAGVPYGYVCDRKGSPLTLQEIARVTNAGSPEEVGKLIAGILEKGAASRDRNGRLYNRRMSFLKKAPSRKKAEAGKLGGMVTANRHWGKSHLLQQPLQQAPQQPAIPLTFKEVSKKENLSSFGTPQSATGPPQEASEVGSEHLAAIVRAKGWK